jgi:hypothetical protein
MTMKRTSNPRRIRKMMPAVLVFWLRGARDGVAGVAPMETPYSSAVAWTSPALAFCTAALKSRRRSGSTT